MSITEKSLELNVTHELLVLGQGLASVFWTNAPPTGHPLPPPTTPIYAAGLSLKDEAHYGWDVSIELPPAGATPSQVFFLQFKLGQSRLWSKYPNTVFPPNNPNSDHVLFSINNNTFKNQHSRLKRTARRFGQPFAAIYALPLITDAHQLAVHAGNLLSRTAFVTAPAIDRSASPAIRDGKDRKIAISRSAPQIREVRSEAALIDEVDVGTQLISEIVAVRLHREMATWQRHYRSEDYLSAGRIGPGRMVADGILRWLGYFFRDPFTMNLTAESIGRRDIWEPAYDGNRAQAVADFSEPLIAALYNNVWPEKLPELPRGKLLIEIAGRSGAIVEMGEEDRPGPARLSYVVV